LLIALASAGASLANGVANAASSTALMTSQCTASFMVVIALIAGAALGVSGLALRQRFSAPPQPLQPVERRPAWLLGAPKRPALPAPDLADLEDDDELAEALEEALRRW
jgi:hypothetical protein